MPAFELNNALHLEVRTIDERSYEQEGIYVYCRKIVIENSGVPLEYEVGTYEWAEPVYPCRVLHRLDHNNYTVEIFNEEFDADESRERDISAEFVHAILWSVPRDIFYFIDAKYERDHHMEWSFRHDIRVPDDLFPPAWMDLPLVPLRNLTEEPNQYFTTSTANASTAMNTSAADVDHVCTNTQTSSVLEEGSCSTGSG